MVDPMVEISAQTDKQMDKCKFAHLYPTNPAAKQVGQVVFGEMQL